MKGISLKAVSAVAATYFYFLIFAQFAFLERVKGIVSSAQLEPIMAVMGGCGLFASLLAARAMRSIAPQVMMRIAFLGCALTAFIIPWSGDFGKLLALAGGIGSVLGFLTVSLATGLVDLTGGRRLGLQVGLGTGLAYFMCNVPAIFSADPGVQAVMAGIACVAAFLLQGRTLVLPSETNITVGETRWFTRLGFAVVILCFFALIWMDSAVFFVIQQNVDYKLVTWGGARLWLDATLHLGFALLAGLAIDRGVLRPVLLGAYGLLTLGAAALILAGPLVGFAAPLYVSGVSLYSVALVAFPSLHGAGEGLVDRRWRAGWLYGIAGWVGSAMGIGMARDLQRIPPLFLVVAGIVVAAVWVLSTRQGPRVAKLIGLGFVSLLAGCALQSEEMPRPERAVSAEAGREVYIAEGCIHCHSQYVRPDTLDVERWGPYRDLETLRKEKPPLFGNRRQGPDLLNVGNRRSWEWQKLHLQDPRLVAPGSRMPSYAHLFEDQRGNDLIAYLQSLGADTVEERYGTIRAWQPAEPLAANHQESARLFQRACGGCHGQGRGDGPAAAHLSKPVRNLVEEPFYFVSKERGEARSDLARIIKYGILGTNMPGHEALSDAQVLGLVNYVMSLRQPSTDSGTSP